MANQIMVIDDDQDILDIIQFVLEDEGYRVATGRDGTMIKYLTELNPDLILLDTRMPGKRGDEICAELKNDPELMRFSIILISAEGDLPKLAHTCNANGYIRKPFDIVELKLSVQKMLAAGIN